GIGAAGEDALRVRSAMAEHIAHRLHAREIDDCRRASAPDACDAAHDRYLVESERTLCGALRTSGLQWITVVNVVVPRIVPVRIAQDARIRTPNAGDR